MNSAIIQRHLSVLAARDCACWDCGHVVRRGETGYRRIGGDYAFICAGCLRRPKEKK